MKQEKLRAFFKKNKIVSDIKSLDQKKVLIKDSRLVSVTSKGLCFFSKTKQLKVSKNFLFSSFLNHPVELFLSEYELNLDGVIHAVSLVGKDLFEIHIQFTETTPQFYRDCFVDLVA